MRCGVARCCVDAPSFQSNRNSPLPYGVKRDLGRDRKLASRRHSYEFLVQARSRSSPVDRVELAPQSQLGWPPMVHAVGVNYASHEAEANDVVPRSCTLGGKGIAIQADVSKTADVHLLFKEVAERFRGMGHAHQQSQALRTSVPQQSPMRRTRLTTRRLQSIRRGHSSVFVRQRSVCVVVTNRQSVVDRGIHCTPRIRDLQRGKKRRGSLQRGSSAKSSRAGTSPLTALRLAQRRRSNG